MRNIFLKLLTWVSAFIMLFTSPGGAIRQPLAAKKCPAFYGAAATAKPLGGKKLVRTVFSEREEDG